jgi:hypothetical protein
MKINPKNKLLTTIVFIIVVIMAGCKKDDFVEIDVLCPIVKSTNPANLANGVLPLSKVITATFNTAMDPGTFTSETFTLEEGTNSPAVYVSGILSYDADNYRLSFTPASNLNMNTIYTATIKRSVKELKGNELRQDYVWKFSMGAPLGPAGVDLQSTDRFGILAGVGVSNNAGASIIYNMDVGIYPGNQTSITGFNVIDGGPGIIINGDFYAADGGPSVAAMLLQAKNDLTSVYLFTEAATIPAPAILAGDQGGKTLTPGIYKSTSSLLIQSGNLTLDALGEPNAVWIFQIASDFTTVGSGPFPSPTGGNVILAGGAQAKNVYWQVGSSVIIGDYTSFNGNILALTSITMNAYSEAVGRMLCQNGSVTLTSTNIINKP